MRVYLELRRTQASVAMSQLVSIGFVPEEPFDLDKPPLEGSPDCVIVAGNLSIEACTRLRQIEGVVSWQSLEE